MIEIQQALSSVAEHCQLRESTVLPLAELSGHILAGDLASDVDSPPFDKAMMDGFAVRAADLRDGDALAIAGQVTAGAEFAATLESGQAVQIMTGAPVPRGADAVVMLEQTATTDQLVRVLATVVPGQNIMRQGTAMRCGEAVMHSGAMIRSEDIGLLAEAGVSVAQVIRKPSLSVIATGDELIDVAGQPAGSQIRNSNGPMLAAMAKAFCDRVTDLGIGPDVPKLLASRITLGLRSDVLVLSGGVSAGVADLVPGLLRTAGVRQVFHKVSIKPGKPIWFGVLESDDGPSKLVFGLPGNPVSSMVCFRVFVAPALQRLAGSAEPTADGISGRLTQSHRQKPGRTTYWPSRLETKNGGSEITPLAWKGSADLKTLAEANCFAIFPGDQEDFVRGQAIRAIIRS